MSRLTAKQQIFVRLKAENYLNPTKPDYQIAIEAGYAEKSASVQASQMLNNPKIQRAIEEYFGKNTMGASEVLAHYTAIARGQVPDVKIADRIKVLDSLAKYHNLINTNNVNLRTWESEAIEAIKSGELDYSAFMDTFNDESLAQRLFREANVPIE